jgi:2-polyprenyl-3-methyl-5-hydroxy-6-metoxy-1,4-benzoquinol methylase
MSFEPHEIAWTPEKSKRIWDYYGSRPQFRSAFFGYIAGPMVARKFMTVVAPVANARILDFSCGQGDVIAALLPHLKDSQEISACDFSNTYVDAVTKRFKGTPHFKSATLMTSLPGPLADGHFDVVYATEVIEHLNDTELDGMLAECKRLLKPGGQVFFTTPNEEDYDAAKIMCPDCGSIFHKWQHLRTWTRDSLRERMERAGFRTRSVEAVAWLNWRGKLLSWLTTRKIKRDGLIYIGETSK